MAQTNPSNGLERRLQAAAAHYDRVKKGIADAKTARDRIIVEAVDAGVSVRTVGRWANLSHAGVMKVIVTSGGLLEG